jgi:hypothetical protein
MTRKFTKPVFFGNDLAGLAIIALHDVLTDALHAAGGLQQPDHPESEEHALQCEEDRRNDQAELEDHVRDIATALGCEHLLKCRFADLPEVVEDPNVVDPEPFI